MAYEVDEKQKLIMATAEEENLAYTSNGSIENVKDVMMP